jgi:hypothetical protein
MTAELNISDGDSASKLGPAADLLPLIPHEIAYLLEPAIRFEKYQFAEQIQEFIEGDNEADFEELASLAERARLAGDYEKVNSWMDAVNEVVDRIIDDRFPYAPSISPEQRQDALSLVNPELSEKAKERAIRIDVELNDSTPVAITRREARRKIQCEASEIVHDMDVYMLFVLFSALDLRFE